MNFEPLNTFKYHWVKGEPIDEIRLLNLNRDEQELFQFVKSNNINTTRLVQEKSIENMY